MARRHQLRAVTTERIMRHLITRLLSVDPTGKAASFGHLFLRVCTGFMIFYIHGWHKLEGGITYLRHGTPWMLATEVAEMGFPRPWFQHSLRPWFNSCVLR